MDLTADTVVKTVIVCMRNCWALIAQFLDFVSPKKSRRSMSLPQDSNEASLRLCVRKARQQEPYSQGLERVHCGTNPEVLDDSSLFKV